jgi:hypothetical protein
VLERVCNGVRPGCDLERPRDLVAYIPHPIDTKISNFYSPVLTSTRRMSKIMLGDLQNPQEGLLNGREGLRQVTLLAHAEDDYTLELPGHHVGDGGVGAIALGTSPSIARSLYDMELQPVIGALLG